MKFNYKLMSLSLAALGLMACSDDIGNGSGADMEFDETNVRYIRTTVSLPFAGASRSQTDNPSDDDGNNNTNSNGDGQTNDDTGNATNPDYEYGYDYENDVRSMILVIANDNDEYITHATITGLTEASQTAQPYHFSATSKIPYSLLEDLYSKQNFFNETSDGSKYKVHLYAFCNYTQHMKEQFDALLNDNNSNIGNTAWLNFVGQVEEKASMAGETPVSTASIWSKRSFLMSNAVVYEGSFPKTLDEWDQYADSEKPIELADEDNPIEVERVAARFDFKDGSPTNTPANTYPIRIPKGLLENINVQDAEDTPQTQDSDDVDYLELYNVKLERMVLVNMSKNFYYLRRVSNDGLGLNGNTDASFSWPVANNNTNQWWPAGIETPNNYVVDSKWYEKSTDAINPSNAADFFNFPLYDINGTMESSSYNNIGGSMGWYISNIQKEGDKTSVLDDNQVKDNWKDQGYKIWRYVTENTIPGVEHQTTVQSTGIIFKAAIQTGKDVDATRNDGKTRYVTEAVKTALTDIYKTENRNKKPSDYPAIYAFHSFLFGGVADIVSEAQIDGDGGDLNLAVDNILGNWYTIRKVTTGADGEKQYEPVEGYKTEKDQFLFVYSSKAPTAGTNQEVVQLNVTIANQILNGVAPTDGSFNYAEGWQYGSDGEPTSSENVKYDINFKKDYGVDSTDPLAEFSTSQFMELCPSRNITVFIPTNDDNEGLGYYCYYFYWNRHNDNLKNGKMGDMEFAVVRNNVYKISVTGIKSIGHPRDTRRDPDPVKPNDPDEEPVNSIEVQVNVLPWVVRVNNIKF